MKCNDISIKNDFLYFVLRVFIKIKQLSKTYNNKFIEV